MVIKDYYNILISIERISLGPDDLSRRVIMMNEDGTDFHELDFYEIDVDTIFTVQNAEVELLQIEAHTKSRIMGTYFDYDKRIPIMYFPEPDASDMKYRWSDEKIIHQMQFLHDKTFLCNLRIISDYLDINQDFLKKDNYSRYTNPYN